MPAARLHIHLHANLHRYRDQPGDGVCRRGSAKSSFERQRSDDDRSLVRGQRSPPVSTDSRGKAIFHLSEDGSALFFKIKVSHIEGATQADIHRGAPSVNGPVTAVLFGPDPAGVTVNGRLACGSITGTDVISVPDSATCPGGIAGLADLLTKMRAGLAYANVDTLTNADGEIRGQMQAVGFGRK